MKLQFKFIPLVPTSKFEMSAKPKSRCGICIYAVDFSSSSPDFQCRGLRSINEHRGKITTFNKAYESNKLHWCSAFKMDKTKYKKL